MKRWPNWPNPAPIFYRLYYDENGRPLFYSMEDLPGTYIEIDRETFARSPSKVRVVNGRLEAIRWKTSSKVTPGNIGTPCHPEDVCIVVTDGPAINWSCKTYESN